MFYIRQNTVYLANGITTVYAEIRNVLHDKSVDHLHKVV